MTMESQLSQARARRVLPSLRVGFVRGAPVTSKAPVTTSVALVSSSFLLLVVSFVTDMILRIHSRSSWTSEETSDAFGFRGIDVGE